MTSIRDQKKQKKYLKFLQKYSKNPEMLNEMTKAQKWIEQEYVGEDLDKLVFTKVDMEKAFNTGRKQQEQNENLDLSYKATQRLGW